jgi:hypothetical protein
MLSEARKRFKIANISLAVVALLLIADLILFHDNEEVMGIVGIAAVVFSFALLMVLDQRQYRAEISNQRDQG